LNSNIILVIYEMSEEEYWKNIDEGKKYRLFGVKVK
jgi:hypothetical protein